MSRIELAMIGCALFIAISSCALIGCSASTDSQDPMTREADKNGSEVESTPDISVEIGSWNDVQQIIAENKGKVVVVDLWSTSCVPCIREFPNLVALQKEFPDSVTCVSLCLNYDGSTSKPPESHVEDVTEFLIKQEAYITNVICNEVDFDIYDKLDLASIPAVYVYGIDGELAKRFDNADDEYEGEGFTYEQHIVPLVKELME